MRTFWSNEEYIRWKIFWNHPCVVEKKSCKKGTDEFIVINPLGSAARTTSSRGFGNYSNYFKGGSKLLPEKRGMYDNVIVLI